jgi:hypothetical protein
MIQISVEYPARVSSVDCVGRVGFTPALKGGILSSQKDRMSANTFGRRVTCRLVGHEWKVKKFRVTHGQVVCTRCARVEWRRN